MHAQWAATPPFLAVVFRARLTRGRTGRTRTRTGAGSRAGPPELKVLNDPARVADDLAVEHQQRNPELTAQSLDLGAPGAPLGHDHGLERDPLTPQGPRHLAAGA